MCLTYNPTTKAMTTKLDLITIATLCVIFFALGAVYAHDGTLEPKTAPPCTDCLAKQSTTENGKQDEVLAAQERSRRIGVR